MRRLAVLALALLAVAGAQQVELEAEVFDIARQLRCPVCTSESVADSNAQVSLQMREIIQDQLAEGRSREQILAYFQDRYGDWILLEPPKRGLHLFVWVVPIIGAVLGVVVLTLLVRRWTREASRPVELSEDDRRLVDEAMRGNGASGTGGESR